MTEIDNVFLLHRFHQCSHLLHAGSKYRGQGRLLSLLLDRGTLTQKELIEITGRRSATLSEQLDGMESAGYITRVRNKQDKRNVDVTLTPEGCEAAREAIAYRIARADALFGQLTESEKAQLELLLSKLYDHWQTVSEQSNQTNQEGKG